MEPHISLILVSIFSSWKKEVPTLEEKPWFTTGVYDCFLVERNILQLTV
jgi:hypothetical protein